MQIYEKILKELKKKASKDEQTYNDYENPHFLTELVELIENFYDVEVDDSITDMIDDFYGM